MNLAESVAARLRTSDFDRWMGDAARVGYCSNPVKLAGSAVTLDADSGVVLREFDSGSAVDGVAYVRCGNRRAQRCASCSHEYKGDTWHMIMAGAGGGMKGVPDTVREHPTVFLTLTAPSFGAVHSEAGSRAVGVCEHGRPRGCRCGHSENEAHLGDPVCPECYDYERHIVWQFCAPELWRRFTIQLRRRLARELGLTQRAAAEIVRVQFAKVAEFQKRGAVHFHAIIRLDGVDERTEFVSPPPDVTEEHLVAAIREAARSVAYEAPALPGGGARPILQWGKQIDIRPIVRRDGLEGALSDRAVAAYIAKYATKATDDLDGAENGRKHIRMLRATAEAVADVAEPDSAYVQLRKWSSMLGFRGHFSSKSRRYSITLGELRGARRRWRLDRVIQHAREDGHDTDDVLVIGQWSFAGMGWRSEADKLLAMEAARAAREWRAAKSRENGQGGRTDHEEQRRDH
ncbi:replication initiator [Microbacterium halotolerans]|uniref:replication initiator n=1 Tax=Microbacterium halotolerans TaxID=246613 RepID=UPI000E6AC6F8|nr:replication initiator [Microbacterium halotolerans]